MFKNWILLRQFKTYKKKIKICNVIKMDDATEELKQPKFNVLKLKIK